MSHQPVSTKKNVIRLRPAKTPHPTRIQAVQDWHANQAIADDPAVAMVYFSVTACGQIRSTTIGVEREHSAALASEIHSIAKRVAEHALGGIEPLKLRMQAGARE